MNKEKKIFQIDNKEICITSSQIKQAIDLLVNENEILQQEIERLEKRNKEIYEGFMATQEELKEYAVENERLHSIIKEVKEWAKKYSCQFTNDDGELVVSEISFNIQARPCDLFKILDKGE